MRDGYENISRAIAIVHQSEIGRRRNEVRTAMQSTSGLFGRCNGYVDCVCSLHDLLRKALRPGTPEVISVIMQGESKAS